MTTTSCPPVEELARAVSQGAQASLSEHVAGCDRCSAEWNGMQRVRSLARQLPAPAVDASAASAVRSRVLREAIGARRIAGRGRAVAAAAFALAAAAVVVALLRGGPGAPPAPALHHHATVTPMDGARFARLGAAPDEVIRLEAGRIHVDVTPLTPGERCVVHAGDGEVEVRGTAFDVTVLEGHLTSVHVDHGRVEVRSAGAPPVMLGGGSDWKRLATTTPEPTRATVPPEPPPSPSPPSPAHSASPARSAASALSSAAPSSAPSTESAPPASSPTVTPVPATPVAPSVGVPKQPSTPDDRDRREERRERRDDRRERMNERRYR